MPHRTRARPRRSKHPPLGQHFLADERIRRKILDWLRCRPGDRWLEIGAGHGEMTGLLAATGAQVTAVETDPRLVETLQSRFAEHPKVQVLPGDILEVALDSLADARGAAQVRVYGNLPYYITSPILHRLYAATERIADIFVVIQQEVAERLAARPGSREYGYLSVVTQFHATPDVLWRVPRGAFRPPAQVESCLVELVPPGKSAELEAGDRGAFLRFVGACFRQKRKTLVNNLRALYGAAQVQEALRQAGLSERARAEELWLPQFADLYRALR